MPYSETMHASVTLWHEEITDDGASVDVKQHIDVRYRWRPAEPDVGVMAPYVEIESAVDAETGEAIDGPTVDNLALMLEADA